MKTPLPELPEYVRYALSLLPTIEMKTPLPEYVRYALACRRLSNEDSFAGKRQAKAYRTLSDIWSGKRIAISRDTALSHTVRREKPEEGRAGAMRQ